MLMKRPHVGILINNGDQFINGSEQQPLFLLETLQAMGVAFTLYTHTGSVDKHKKSGLSRSADFHGNAMRLLNDSDLSHLTTFIMICHIVDSPDTDAVREKLKHCKVVQFHCGNHCYFNAEDVVFNKHDVVKLLHNTWFHETWVFPMHRFASSYYELLTGKPTKVMPYVWSPTLIDRYCLDHGLDVACDPLLYKDGAGLSLCCFEPNLNVTKTCLAPLLIMNRVYQKRPALIKKCMLFCAHHLTKHQPFVDFLAYLDIAKANLLEIYPRVPLPQALAQMKEKNIAPVIIGHQIANSQNYMYLECLHLGYPLVHNSPALETVGFFYDEWALDVATDKILKFQLDFTEKHSLYLERGRNACTLCHPAHASNVMGFKRLLR